MVFNALIAGGRLLGAEQQAMHTGWGKLSHIFPHPGRVACCPAPDRRPPTIKALHTICGNNTIVVSSSWWWTCKCPKHVEQIISAIKHSVASSWFSSLRLYNDKRPNVHQVHFNSGSKTYILQPVKGPSDRPWLRHHHHHLFPDACALSLPDSLIICMTPLI